MKVLRNVSPKSFSAEEKIYFKQHTHTEENLYCLVTISSSFAKPQKHSDGEMTP